MKITIITVSVLIILVLALQSFSSSKTEEQSYKLIEEYDGFEIREYPPAIMASVTMNASNYKDVSSPGFRTLAGYIFGGNEEEMSIAMTAPVYMAMSDSVSKMSFVMPAQYDMNDLPNPNNGQVILEETPPQKVAVVKFSGYANDQKIAERIKELDSLLGSAGIEHMGDFKFLGYNPPYQVVNRRNEVMVSLK